MMAKQLNSFERGRKASRLKRLRNRSDQKKFIVIFTSENVSGSNAWYRITLEQKIFEIYT